MRTIILLTVMLLGALVHGLIANAQSATNIFNETVQNQTNRSVTAAYQGSHFDLFTQELIKNWIKGAETNGLCCAVSFDRPPQGKKSHPICYVHLINNSTNFFYGGLSLSPDMLFEVELFDSQGKPVSNTSIGKKFGASVTDQQLNDWYKKNVNRHGAGTFLVPPFFVGDVNQFAITQVFELKQAGEYMLHLHMRLIQCQFNTKSEVSFVINRLPEVTAKVQILPEDITPPDLPAYVQTNSLPK